MVNQSVGLVAQPKNVTVETGTVVRHYVLDQAIARLSRWTRGQRMMRQCQREVTE